MVHDSLNDLKFDLRLQNRRGWLTQAEQDAHLESLPDVADKGEVVGDEPAAAPAPAAAPQAAETADSGFGAAPVAEAPAAPVPPATSSWGGNDNDQ